MNANEARERAAQGPSAEVLSPYIDQCARAIKTAVNYGWTEVTEYKVPSSLMPAIARHFQGLGYRVSYINRSRFIGPSITFFWGRL